MTSISQYQSLWYSQVILVREYPVLTAVSWSQHWCPIYMHYQFSCALKLARKYEIEHWKRSSKTINWSVDSFLINHVTSTSWHMSLWYWLSCFADSCQLTILWMTNKDVDLPRHALLFGSLPYPTLTIWRRSANHVTTKQKEVDNILWVWGSVPCALKVRVGALL